MHFDKYNEKTRINLNFATISDVNPATGIPWVQDFEHQFANLLGAKFAIAVNSATSGLHACLLSLGIGPNDEVISPGLTVIMDAFATIYTGARPVFCDVDAGDWNIDPLLLESLITPKTKAVISVSWFGLPSRNKQIREICDRHGLYLIDDSAELISKHPSVIKNWSYAHFRVYSFESKKHFSTGGEGGMVLTDDSNLAARVRKCAGLGYRHLDAEKGRTSLAARIFQNPEYERFDSIGLNYRMTPFMAAVGLAQIERLDFLLQSRIDSAQILLEVVRGVDWLIPQLPQVDGMPHSYYSFGLYLDATNPKAPSWQEFYDAFVKSGGHGFYSNCLNPYREPVFRDLDFSRMDESKSVCPIAERLQKGIMAFKTNYLDFDVCKDQAIKLQKVIESFA